MSNLNLSVLSSAEKRTRRRWKIFFLTVWSILGVICLLAGILNIAVEGKRGGEVGAYTVGVLIFMLPFYIFYRCAYQKAGIRLLYLQLVTAPLLILPLVSMLFFK